MNLKNEGWLENSGYISLTTFYVRNWIQPILGKNALKWKSSPLHLDNHRVKYVDEAKASLGEE